MHFLFNLLRINGLYLFRALLAHPREALHSDTWYIACVLYQLAALGLKWKLGELNLDISQTMWKDLHVYKQGLFKGVAISASACARMITAVAVDTELSDCRRSHTLNFFVCNSIKPTILLIFKHEQAKQFLSYVQRSCAQLDKVTHENTTPGAYRPPTVYSTWLQQVTQKDKWPSLKMAYKCRNM
jgi:hypothetical protein